VSAAARLYTPEILGLATRLAAVPLEDDLPLRGSARSALCGSSLEIGIELDEQGTISRLGLMVRACAIGQAAAAVFASAAVGRDRAGIARAEADIAGWLGGEGAALPDWPGLSAVAPAQAYPARHGAILLAWRAALEALP
jgi:NifU-like protein involved in Fe-S cluster formation